MLNSLKVNNFYGDFDEIIHELLDMDVFDYLSAEDYRKAIELQRFYNFSINFADCTIDFNAKAWNY